MRLAPAAGGLVCRLLRPRRRAFRGCGLSEDQRPPSAGGLRSAADMADAWEFDKGTSDKVVAGLPVLLRYLGLDLLVKLGTGLAIQVRKQGPGWAHFSATMSAGSNARPIPQYGSLAHGNYDVVCFWGRAGMEHGLLAT